MRLSQKTSSPVDCKLILLSSLPEHYNLVGLSIVYFTVGDHVPYHNSEESEKMEWHLYQDGVQGGPKKVKYPTTLRVFCYGSIVLDSLKLNMERRFYYA